MDVRQSVRREGGLQAKLKWDETTKERASTRHHAKFAPRLRTAEQTANHGAWRRMRALGAFKPLAYARQTTGCHLV